MEHAQLAASPARRKAKRTSAGTIDQGPIAPHAGFVIAPAVEEPAARIVATTGWHDLSEEAYHADPCPVPSLFAYRHNYHRQATAPRLARTSAITCVRAQYAWTCHGSLPLEFRNGPIAELDQHAVDHRSATAK